MSDKQETVQHASLDAAILEVMRECPYVQKTGKVDVGKGYKYASEADLIAKVHASLIRNGITIRPSEVTVQTSESYKSAKGGDVNRTVIKVKWKISHPHSGTSDTAETFGEACDNGDKSFAKATTMALKYLLRQLFVIETGNDPDQTSSDDNTRAIDDPTSGEMADSFVRARDAVRRAATLAQLKQYRSVWMLNEKREWNYRDVQISALEEEYRRRVAVLEGS